MSNSKNPFKILTVLFLIWALLTTVSTAYYYNESQLLLSKYNSIRSKLASLKTSLEKIREYALNLNTSYSNLLSSYAKLNQTYANLTRLYNSLIEKLNSYLNRSVAILIIDYGNGTIQHFKAYFIEGYNDSVLNITIAFVNVNYTYYKEYNDVFVNAINGVYNKRINATSGYYWMLYVNLKLSSHGALQTKVHDGDVIIWRYMFVKW